MTEYACDPACVPCRRRQECDGPDIPEFTGRHWAPNQEPDTLLKCGCSIPWPVITLLGSGGKVLCDEHGPQKVAQETISQARKRMKIALRESGQEELDAPPF